ncbi:Oidioi.mRNA.OKI2018_I69.chr1.g2675.t1.cds [Oikopleura dioica]|uniref:Oidioi.mRNA.OKI2018_I69.chr1.g2675.t1.cds n=1 Tax=Oikopleura dioica TaxID=34765 RepID=A0ABN7SRR7_OIKDI|nr:Oidioi.mRNA.OKI2018_I69.chr1.g2675.t1.cds [Oikopleura dioica]
MAWRQIATAYRKWILRYMAECRGQINHQLHTRRLIKVASKINKLTFEVNGVKPIDFTRAVWRNVGYEVTDAPEETTTPTWTTNST